MTRLRPGAATRATVALVVPIAVGGSLGHADFGTVGGVAALLTVLPDLGHELRSWRNLQFAAVLMPVVAALGVLLGPDRLMLATVFAAMMGLAGLLYAVSPLTKGATMAPALGLLIVAGLHLPRVDILWVVASAAAGAAFALLLSAVSAQIRHTTRHDPRTLPQTLSDALSTVRRHLCNPRDPMVLYAIVLAAVSFTSLLAATVIDPGRSFWVAMAAVIIVKPDAITTLHRAFQRLVGTVIAIAIVVTLVVSDVPVGVVVAVVTGMLFVGVLCITAQPMVAALGTAPLPLVGAVASPATTEVLGEHRVVDATAGIAVSVLTMIAFLIILHRIDHHRERKAGAPGAESRA